MPVEGGAKRQVEGAFRDSGFRVVHLTKHNTLFHIIILSEHWSFCLHLEAARTSWECWEGSANVSGDLKNNGQSLCAGETGHLSGR